MISINPRSLTCHVTLPADVTLVVVVMKVQKWRNEMWKKCK